MLTLFHISILTDCEDTCMTMPPCSTDAEVMGEDDPVPSAEAM